MDKRNKKGVLKFIPYDYENRLIEIRKTYDTIAVVTFEYDALGRRIEMVDFSV